MKWCNTKRKIDYKNEKFNFIIAELVFKCPTSIKKGKEYTNVSKRSCTFRDRKISHGLLNTLLSEIRKPLMKNGTYIIALKDDEIETKYKEFNEKVSIKDPNYEIIIYKERNDMSKAETIYYYIRNAFAHGDFEIITVDDSRVYKLESESKGDKKAWIRLKEKTLLRYIELSNLSPQKIINLRNKSKIYNSIM